MPSFTSPATLAALKTRLHKTFNDMQAAAPVFSDGLFTQVPSDTLSNTYDWLAGISGMSEWVGPRTVESFKERVFTIQNKHYEKTLEVDANALSDSPMSAISDASLRLGFMMEAAAKLQDDLAVSLLQNGHAALCYDGQFFFDTDHPTDLDASGSQTNYSASGMALSSANFITVRARMLAYKGESGRALRGGGQFVLYVPPALESTANTIVTAEVGSSGATNVTKGQASVKVVPELAGADATWYLVRQGGMGPAPLIMQNRQPVRLTTLTADNDENVFWRNKLVFGIDKRCGAGYGAWFNAYKAAA